MSSFNGLAFAEIPLYDDRRLIISCVLEVLIASFSLSDRGCEGGGLMILLRSKC